MPDAWAPLRTIGAASELAPPTPIGAYPRRRPFRSAASRRVESTKLFSGLDPSAPRRPLRAPTPLGFPEGDPKFKPQRTQMTRCGKGKGDGLGGGLHIANCSLLICHCREMRPAALGELSEHGKSCGPFPVPNVQCEMSNEQCAIKSLSSHHSDRRKKIASPRLICGSRSQPNPSKL